MEKNENIDLQHKEENTNENIIENLINYECLKTLNEIFKQYGLNK
jgi:hypothetical protein